MANYRSFENFRRGLSGFGQGLGTAIGNYMTQRRKQEEDERKWQAIRSHADRLSSADAANAERFGVPQEPGVSPEELRLMGHQPDDAYRILDQTYSSRKPKWDLVTSPEGERVMEGLYGNRVVTQPVMGPDNQPIKKPVTPSEQAMKLKLAEQDEDYRAGKISFEQAWSKVQERMLAAAAGLTAGAGAAARDPYTRSAEQRDLQRETEKRIRKLKSDVVRLKASLAAKSTLQQQMEKDMFFVDPATGQLAQKYSAKGLMDTYYGVKNKVTDLEAELRAAENELQDLTPTK